MEESGGERGRAGESEGVAWGGVGRGGCGVWGVDRRRGRCRLRASVCMVEWLDGGSGLGGVVWLVLWAESVRRWRRR